MSTSNKFSSEGRRSMSTENFFITVDNANPDSGFTKGDVVRLYKNADQLSYPCIVLSCETVENFRVEALRGVLGSRSMLEQTDSYFVYIHFQNTLVQIGQMPATKIKPLLDNKVFDVFKKRIHMDENSCVEGDMLYALCISNLAGNIF